MTKSIVKVIVFVFLTFTVAAIFIFFKKMSFSQKEESFSENSHADFYDPMVDIENVSNVFFHGEVIASVEKTKVKLTVESKKEREAEIAKEGEKGITQQELYDALIRKGADIEVDMALRMQSGSMTVSDWEKIDIYAAELLSEDDNFKIELLEYHNFYELNEVFEARMKKTGVFYGTEMLREGNAYKGADFESIKRLIDAGAILPEDFIAKVTCADNLDLAMRLNAAGVSINSGFVDKATSMNAIESQVEAFAINPYGSSAEQKIDKVQKLIDLGVPLKLNDGTRDALDLALQGASEHDEIEANKLMILAKSLHDQGILLEPSHYQLLDKLKYKHPILYDHYAGYFK